MFGLLNIDKPVGLTSRDVVNRVQRAAGTAKVGHAGTLDPLATGVLVVCVGPATRLVEFVQRKPKRYRATFLLGRQSNTDDIEGEVIERPDLPVPTVAQIEAALPRFVGQIQQRPPAFSAIKVAGRRSYDLARAGQQVDLAPRPVSIDGICVLGFEYPELHLEIICGSGTYVRAIGRDLAEVLGTAAVMSALQRTAIGEFTIDRAVALESLTAPDRIAASLLSPRLAVSDLPAVELSAAEGLRIQHGQAIADRFGIIGIEIAALDADGNLTAILTSEHPGELRPLRNFPRE